MIQSPTSVRTAPWSAVPVQKNAASVATYPRAPKLWNPTMAALDSATTALSRSVCAALIGEDNMKCQHEGCEDEGIECYLSAYDTGKPRTEATEPDEYFCAEHANAHGYCWGCGDFWAGVETFDFNPRGLCDNCKDDPDLAVNPDDEDDDYDFDLGDDQ